METKKIPAVLCDIDGTLARHDPAKRSPYDHAKSYEDELRQEVSDLLDLVSFGSNCADDHNGGRIKIILVTGRREKFRDVTEAWLHLHMIPYDNLLMRGDDDNRPDNEVKKDIYLTHIEPEFRVMFILDDRQRVVDMWRKELNLPCFQVNYGDF